MYILVIYIYRMDIQQILNSCEGFQWDGGNSLKSWLKHHVSQGEAEQIFFNDPLLLVMDPRHSQDEARYWALGYTDDDRQLFIVFTIRKNLIRVISARNMNRKEKVDYEKFKTNS
ncbi:MAG: BrnT family toxin [Candidatus Omnitrophica bacterium]|nr:BrnT family toxin [Candidatus Omnitrophota bacterium]